MAEYSSLKVPELKKLLAEKKLPQTGNKADLIARLQDDDMKNAKDAPTANSTSRPEDKEDEITYSDDEAPPPPPSASVPAPAPAPTTAPASAPKAAESDAQPAQETKLQPAATAEPVPTESADKAERPNGEVAAHDVAASFALGMDKTIAEAEAKKRADRAKRFGIEEDHEAKRRADRAKRFGIDETELASGLDSALPERPLKRGRLHGFDDDSRSGKRRNLDRRADRQPAQGRDGRPYRQTRSNGPAKRDTIFNDPTERAKAEKRAARFAAA